jgi:hypothetical protein
VFFVLALTFSRGLRGSLNGLISGLSSHILRAAVCMLCLASGAHAAVPRQQAEEIMKLSGLWDQLGSVLPQARLGLTAAFSLGESEPTLEEADRFNGALEAAYSPDRLRQLGLTRVSRSLDARQVALVKRWFGSPLGRRIDEVERAASATQTDLREVIRKGSEAVEMLPDARRDLLSRLLKATRADEAMVEVSVHTLVATHKGVSGALAEGSRLTNDEVKATLTAEREPMLKAYTQLILSSFVQAYAALSDDELRRYVDYLYSPAGKRQTQLAYRSLMAALNDGATAFVKNAAEALKAPTSIAPTSITTPTTTTPPASAPAPAQAQAPASASAVSAASAPSAAK